MMNAWIIRDPAHDTRALRLFCLPFAGGGASVYRDWPGAAPHNVQVCRVQLPGRETRIDEPACVQMQPLIADLLDALQPLLQDKPYGLFGHSLGGILVFELCRQLAERGWPLPQVAFLSATRPPHAPDPAPIHDLAQPAFTEALRQRGGTPALILDTPELLDVFVPTLRCDLALAERWHHPDLPELAVPLMILNGRQDSIVKAANATTWRRYSRGEPRVIEFDAGHFFLNSHAQQVREAVFAHLLEQPSHLLQNAVSRVIPQGMQ